VFILSKIHFFGGGGDAAPPFPRKRDLKRRHWVSISPPRWIRTLENEDPRPFLRYYLEEIIKAYSQTRGLVSRFILRAFIYKPEKFVFVGSFIEHA